MDINKKCTKWTRGGLPYVRTGHIVQAMKLKSYLREAQISYGEFAQRVGAANAGVVAKWIAGDRFPRGKFLEAIRIATDGKVLANDFAHADVEA